MVDLNTVEFNETDSEKDEIFNEGRLAYFDGAEEHQNPYDGLLAEYWSDGWADAQDDDEGN